MAETLNTYQTSETYDLSVSTRELIKNQWVNLKGEKGKLTRQGTGDTDTEGQPTTMQTTGNNFDMMLDHEFANRLRNMGGVALIGAPANQRNAGQPNPRAPLGKAGKTKIDHQGALPNPLGGPHALAEKKNGDISPKSSLTLDSMAQSKRKHLQDISKRKADAALKSKIHPELNQTNHTVSTRKRLPLGQNTGDTFRTNDSKTTKPPIP